MLGSRLTPRMLVPYERSTLGNTTTDATTGARTVTGNSRY